MSQVLHEVGQLPRLPVSGVAASREVWEKVWLS